MRNGSLFASFRFEAKINISENRTSYNRFLKDFCVQCSFQTRSSYTFGTGETQNNKSRCLAQREGSRHGSTRVPGHAFLAWHSSWQCFVYIEWYVDQPQTGASGVVRQGRRHGSSITYKITPCWVTLLQLARRGWPQCWTSPLAFGLFGLASQLQL